MTLSKPGAAHFLMMKPQERKQQQRQRRKPAYGILWCRSCTGRLAGILGSIILRVTCLLRVL